MKYYKALVSATNGYITKYTIYKETDHGNDKNNATTFVTISEWIKTLGILSRENEFEEVSKREYLLFKVKELKDKILDKNNGFYIKGYIEIKMFFDILNKLCIRNLHDVSTIETAISNNDYYVEQHSGKEDGMNWSYRSLRGSNQYIEKYNLNLIKFKDLIDEIKEIYNEV